LYCLVEYSTIIGTNDTNHLREKELTMDERTYVRDGVHKAQLCDALITTLNRVSVAEDMSEAAVASACELFMVQVVASHSARHDETPAMLNDRIADFAEVLQGIVPWYIRAIYRFLGRTSPV
jgi:hypothetical protein